MTDTTQEQEVSDDDADEGSLAAAFRSAGFGSDDTMDDEAEETAAEDQESETDGEPPDSEADSEPEAEDDSDSEIEAVVEAAVDADDPTPVDGASGDDSQDEESPRDEGAEDEGGEDEGGEDEGAEDEGGEDEGGEDEGAEDEGAEEEVEEPEPISPYDLPGAWYVIHSYSGYENKVKANLATRTSSMHMEDRIFEVVIPMETVVEIKGGRKVEVEKEMFPGYILVRMYLEDDSWYAVRNTPGVTAFVGGGSKPTPLSRREVERFLGVKKAEEKKAPRFKPAWEVGETVRVVNGPFADFNGVIEDMNVDQQKVRVLVEIFGRDTPMELNFEDIQKQ